MTMSSKAVFTDLRQKLDYKKNQDKALAIAQKKSNDSGKAIVNGNSDGFSGECREHDEDALNFEPKEGQCHYIGKEDGETSDADTGKKKYNKTESEPEKSKELEEGEVTDEEEKPHEPKKVCPYYIRGKCTWGMSCRFLHPGVPATGYYNLFDLDRQFPVPPAGVPSTFYPDFRYERPPLIHRPRIHHPDFVYPTYEDPRGHLSESVAAGFYNPVDRFGGSPPVVAFEEAAPYGCTTRYREFHLHPMPQYENERRVPRGVSVQRVDPVGRVDERCYPGMRSKWSDGRGDRREPTGKRQPSIDCRSDSSDGSNTACFSSGSSSSDSSAESCRALSSAGHRRRYNSGSHSSLLMVRQHVGRSVRPPSPPPRRLRSSPSLRHQSLFAKRRPYPSPSPSRYDYSPAHKRKKMSTISQKLLSGKHRISSSSSDSSSSDPSSSESDSSSGSSSTYRSSKKVPSKKSRTKQTATNKKKETRRKDKLPPHKRRNL